MNAIPKFRQLPRKSRFVLEYATDENGNDGWRLAGMHGFDAVAGKGAGMTIAHDIFEHFTHANDCSYSEFEAFGCMLWGRIGGEYWYSFNNEWSVHNSTRDDAQVMGDEIGQFYTRLDGVTTAPAWAYQALKDEEVEQFVQKMIPFVRRGIVDETNDTDRLADLLHLNHEEDEPEYAAEYERALEEAAQDAIAWVRYGYTHADQTWGKLGSPFDFCNMFYNLETLIDSEFTHGDHGDALVIRVDRKYSTVEVRRGYFNDHGRVAYHFETQWERR